MWTDVSDSFPWVSNGRIAVAGHHGKREIAFERDGSIQLFGNDLGRLNRFFAMQPGLVSAGRLDPRVLDFLVYERDGGQGHIIRKNDPLLGKILSEGDLARLSKYERTISVPVSVDQWSANFFVLNRDGSVSSWILHGRTDGTLITNRDVRIVQETGYVSWPSMLE